MTNANEPAYPAHGTMGEVIATGLTKREAFALAAMQGILANPARCAGGQVEGDVLVYCGLLGRAAITIADATLAELAKDPA